MILSLKYRFRKSKSMKRKRKRKMKKIGGGPISRIVKVKKEVAPSEVPGEVTLIKEDTKTVEPGICPTNVEIIKKQLTSIGITSFANKEEAKSATTSDMQKYDKTAKRTQLFENAVRLLHIAGCAVPLVSSLAEVTLAVVTGVSNFNKSKALTYLASQCLTYVANISRDLAEMFAFYSNSIVIYNNIKIDNVLYGVLQKNLYTFFYFLIDSITFEITEHVGSQHYLYWYTFLLKVDFSRGSDYSKPIPSDKYRYSCKECIPLDTLRKKLITLDKTVVTLENPELSVLQKIRQRNRTDEMKKKDKLLGFCSEDLLAVCKNYNDNIMRLIELNMYILINSAYKNKTMIDILKYSEKGLSAEFSNAVFSTKKISDETKETFKKRFSITVIDDRKSPSDIKRFVPDLELTFNFLIQLNRIISELEYPLFIVKPSNNNVTTKRARALNFATGFVVNAASLITKPARVFFSTPKLQHEELMREYTLMTGNFLMMTSRFTLDYNKLGVVDKEVVYIMVTEKLKSVASALAIVKDHLNAGADSVNNVATNLRDDAGGVPDGVTTDSTEGGRNLSKKKYKYSKKCKTKRNKRKRCGF